MVTLAARNNAEWCELVCRAHRVPGEFRDGIWINRHAVPRYYPNASTFAERGDHRAHVRELKRSGIPGPWAVKDSFVNLDLDAEGFRPLFDAQWILRTPGLPSGVERQNPLLHVETVTSAKQLERWEAAWSAASGEPAGHPRVFLPELFESPDVAIIAISSGATIIAGAIANRSARVVGLSNLFAARDRELECGARLVQAIEEKFPSFPIVGYDRGEELERMIRLGFAPIGPLRFWIAAS